jgi:hypothetical protein
MLSHHFAFQHEARPSPIAGAPCRCTIARVPENVTREDVQRLLAEGAQLVEVLPRGEYEELHLAGAVNIPLKELGERAAELDAARPVITYCHDFL